MRDNTAPELILCIMGWMGVSLSHSRVDEMGVTLKEVNFYRQSGKCMDISPYVSKIEVPHACGAVRRRSRTATGPPK
jgi:hypothetical protein